ncbi:PQQ-dependent sugar dehydrogenase [Dactylosporangium sp. NPDC000521]|uniref:PQQ-dependent sugar dehydrogenase n=1 Tax=Dactylosporangium sp. NPDC000521 TaxID=3363975 RepID=UPI0036CE4FF2
MRVFRSHRRFLRAALIAAIVVTGAAVVLNSRRDATAATAVPSGFQEQIVFSGLDHPTSARFAADGRVFVAQKNGVVVVFDNLADGTPTTFADLSAQVSDVWDRGLLGLALAPNFPVDPSVYVLYTYDAPLGGAAPFYNDVCNVGGGGAGGNCVASGRLSKLTANGNQSTGTEQVLISDWCQQFPSHSIGDLNFGPDGALYVSAGDGASFNATDFGQFGAPVNPCGDPVNEGGAMRSQDSRSTGDPTGLNGAILRIDPATGAALPNNPQAASADVNTRRIIAQGLRNPYRFAVRPGSGEIWVGDTGWNTWEEIDRIANPLSTVSNFGWPCYEGAPAQPGYQSANLPLCQSLYSSGDHVAPYYAYNHANKVVAGESCPTGGSGISGVAFYPDSGGSYPAAYAGALFFADYSRGCIWAMLKGNNGLPDSAKIQTFAAGAASPVQLMVGPGGDVYYVDITGGTIRRIRYFPNNRPPIASIAATPTSGSVPLTVAFDGSSSTDQDPADLGQLTYQWDFDSNGTVDATGKTAAYTYTTAGSFTASLKVTDALGASSTATVLITPGNGAPTAVIDTPGAELTWAVGDTITFGGHASDPQEGTLPASALKWEVLLQHCSTLDACHTHFLQSFNGVDGGTFTAPDHEYPSFVRLRLTATDSGGLTSVSTVDLQPRTVDLTFTSEPAGLQLTVGSASQKAPFTKRVIVGSSNTISAPMPQTSSTATYRYRSWSDSGGQTHTITAPAAAASYTATYAITGPPCQETFEYTCTAAPASFIAAANATTLSGNDGVTTASLPFPFSFYGKPYSSVFIDVNGVLSFAAPGATSANQAIPAVGGPNAGIYPFWDDLVVSPTGSVRTQTIGTAPNRRFVVEWRNVYINGTTPKLFSVEAILGENGSIAFAYAGDFSTALNQGSSATVGIEDPSGKVGLRYLYNTAALHSGDGLALAPVTTPKFQRKVNVNSGKCLGMPAGNMTNGTKAVQWTCDGSSDQSWSIPGGVNDGIYYQVKNRVNPTKCLGVPGGSMVEGTQLVIWDCDGSDDQFWTYVSYTDPNCPTQYSLKNLRSGLIVGVSGGNPNNGGLVVQWRFQGLPDQRWC